MHTHKGRTPGVNFSAARREAESASQGLWSHRWATFPNGHGKRAADYRAPEQTEQARKFRAGKNGKDSSSSPTRHWGAGVRKKGGTCVERGWAGAPPRTAHSWMPQYAATTSASTRLSPIKEHILPVATVMARQFIGQASKSPGQFKWGRVLVAQGQWS